MLAFKVYQKMMLYNEIIIHFSYICIESLVCGGTLYLLNSSRTEHIHMTLIAYFCCESFHFWTVRLLLVRFPVCYPSSTDC